MLITKRSYESAMNWRVASVEEKAVSQSGGTRSGQKGSTAAPGASMLQHNNKH